MYRYLWLRLWLRRTHGNLPNLLPNHTAPLAHLSQRRGKRNLAVHTNKISKCVSSSPHTAANQNASAMIYGVLVRTNRNQPFRE